MHRKHLPGVEHLTDVTIRHTLGCGDLGRIVSLHGRVYAPLGGYGLRFEAYVARTVAEFVLDNDLKGRVWLAERDGELVGCSAIALREKRAGQLRWVLVDPSARGAGLGRRLVETALAWCREVRCASVVLETTDGLPEAMRLYEQLGFHVESESVTDLWDGPRPLIRMRLPLSSEAPG